jgi:hypothetical protein
MMDGEAIMIGVAGVALAGVAILSGGNNAIGTLTGQDGAGLKQLRDELNREQLLTATSMDAAAQRSEVALRRYQDGCKIHYRVAEVQLEEHAAMGGITVEYMPVKEGDIPVHHRTGDPYGRGTVLCDDMGNTGMVNGDGVVVDVAYTGADIQGYVRDYFDRRWNR